MNHYPIFSKAWNLNENEWWSYLQTFRQHKITNTRTALYASTTTHRFPDNLAIRFEWNTANFEHPLPSNPTIELLQKLHERCHISIRSHQLISLSDQHAEPPSAESYERFAALIGGRDRLILAEQYEALEKHPSIETKVNEDELHRMVSAYQKFEEYLRGRNQPDERTAT